MTIDWNKPLRTVGTHYPVRVICRDRKTDGKYKIIALVPDHLGGENVWLYQEDGYNAYGASGARIENVPEEMFVNVYQGGAGKFISVHDCCIHATSADAVTSRRLGCIGTYRLVPVGD